jgi:hypothetical protein
MNKGCETERGRATERKGECNQVGHLWESEQAKLSQWVATVLTSA